jgi:hypothetical protein
MVDADIAIINSRPPFRKFPASESSNLWPQALFLADGASELQ